MHHRVLLSLSAILLLLLVGAPASAASLTARLKLVDAGSKTLLKCKPRVTYVGTGTALPKLNIQLEAGQIKITIDPLPATRPPSIKVDVGCPNYRTKRLELGPLTGSENIELKVRTTELEKRPGASIIALEKQAAQGDAVEVVDIVVSNADIGRLTLRRATLTLTVEKQAGGCLQSADVVDVKHVVRVGEDTAEHRVGKEITAAVEVVFPCGDSKDELNVVLGFLHEIEPGKRMRYRIELTGGGIPKNHYRYVSAVLDGEFDNDQAPARLEKNAQLR